MGNTIHLVIAFLIKKILKYRKVEFLSGLIRYRALRKISWIVPPLIVSVLLPFAFSDSPKLLALSEKLTWIYFTVVLSISIDVVLSSVGDVLMSKGKIQDRPMRGLIQIIQVIVALMAVVV
ncbi:MAG: transporter, partial [Bacteroides sp.]